MSQRITKAVVAAAETGTRFLPAAKALPKEMLPIVGKPLIHLVVEEPVEGGIEDVVLVKRGGKQSLEDHFGCDATFTYASDRSDIGRELDECIENLVREG